MLFLITINSARKSIWITNPYFIPDDVMTETLLKAAARGVRVIVLTPGEIDSQLTYTASRSHYGPLLQGGIQIFRVLRLSGKRAVVMLHTATRSMRARADS